MGSTDFQDLLWSAIAPEKIPQTVKMHLLLCICVCLPLLIGTVKCIDTKEVKLDYFPKMPELPANLYSNVDHFVLVSETNVTNQRETSLMVQDVVGEPLGDEDKFSAIDTADDFNSGGFRVDPARANSLKETFPV